MKLTRNMKLALAAVGIGALWFFTRESDAAPAGAAQVAVAGTPTSAQANTPAPHVDPCPGGAPCSWDTSKCCAGPCPECVTVAGTTDYTSAPGATSTTGGDGSGIGTITSPTQTQPTPTDGPITSPSQL